MNPPTRRNILHYATFLLLVPLAALAADAPAAKPKSAPTHADVSYVSHPHQLMDVADKAGVPCLIKCPDHPAESYNDIWDFIVKQLAVTSLK